MPVGLRHLGRSAIHPPASFAKLESPSETPSITPSANAGAPRLARNAGRIEVAASCPQSENRLAKPMPSTPRVSHRFGDEDGFVLERSLMFAKEISGRLCCGVLWTRNFRLGERSRSLFFRPNSNAFPRQAKSPAPANC